MQRFLFTYGKALLFEFLNMKNYNRMFHVKHPAYFCNTYFVLMIFFFMMPTYCPMLCTSTILPKFFIYLLASLYGFDLLILALYNIAIKIGQKYLSG